jgi:hypothetical protein
VPSGSNKTPPETGRSIPARAASPIDAGTPARQQRIVWRDAGEVEQHELGRLLRDGGQRGRVVERGDHAVQAQAAQLVQGVLVEHGGFFSQGRWRVGSRCGARCGGHQWCP